MTQRDAIHVSLIATPEVDASALAGMHGVLNFVAQMVPGAVPFETSVVLPDSLRGRTRADGTILDNVMGLPLPVQKCLRDVIRTDVVLMPSLYLLEPAWPADPYPDLTDWLLRMHDQGALLCSSCTAAFLLAETGLLDGFTATQHWAFEPLFRRRFPQVRLDIDKVLLQTGRSGRIVMSGASAAWHDLVVHVVSQYAGAAAARIMAKYFLLSVHENGQAPYRVVLDDLAHADSTVRVAQLWLREHHHEANAAEHVIALSGLSARTFARRFRKATGCTTTGYVQRLRVDDAKRRLETEDTAIDQISWDVGYEDPSFFRHLFRRLNGLSPREYRRKFRVRPAGY